MEANIGGHERENGHDNGGQCGYAPKGKVVGGVPLPNTLEGPQFRPQPQPLHFVAGRIPPSIVERGKLDHIKVRLRAIEGGRDHAFADMTELYLVLDVIFPPKFRVPNFDKYKGTACPKNHQKLYY